MIPRGHVGAVARWGWALLAAAAWGAVCAGLAKAGGPRRLRWVATGGPLGGLGYDVRICRARPDVVYATDSWSGVNVSADGGRSWRASNQGILTRAGPTGDAVPIFCLTIDPRDARVVWAGTQNTRGIFRSADAGRTWRRRDRGVVERSGITFRGIAVDPTRSQTLYAAAEIASFAWAGREITGREFDRTRGVVYKTTDGGANWRAVWRGDNLARHVCIDPARPSVLYVSTGIFDREAANSDHTRDRPGGVGVLKSTDGGRTWRVLGRTHGLTNLYIGSLAMHPRDGEVLLAAAGNNAFGAGAGAFLTTDGGRTWRRTLDEGSVHSVEFAPSDGRIAYAASIRRVWRSADGGRSWRGASTDHGWGSPGVEAGFPIDIDVDPRRPERLFVNNYLGGNFLSEDGGRTWRVASRGYTGAQVRDVAVAPTDGRCVYAAARSGVFVSRDGGGSWRGLAYPQASGIEWCVVAVDPSAAGRLLGANNAQGVLLQSRNAGRSWRRVTRPIRGGVSFRAVAFAPSDPRTVYAGTNAFRSGGSAGDRIAAAGVYVSRDGGGTWQPANDAHSRDANVTAIAVDPRDPRVAYAATRRRGLLKTTDGGGRWRAVNRGLRGTDAQAVAVDPTDGRRVYAGMEDAGIYVSTDGGAGWRACSDGMDPEASIHDIVIHPKDPKVLYAADVRSGVYRSTDAGKLWVRIGAGLTTRAAQALAMSADGATLYAATEGGGVFRLDTGRPAEAGAR